MALTNKQLKFIDEYLIDLNATQAAIRAGYSKKTANEQGARMLANVSISEVVAKRQAIASENCELTKEMKLAALKQVIDTYLLTGNLTPNALRAIELHNKMLGHDAPIKLEHSGSIDYNLTLPGIIDITPEEDSETEED